MNASDIRTFSAGLNPSPAFMEITASYNTFPVLSGGGVRFYQRALARDTCSCTPFGTFIPSWTSLGLSLPWCTSAICSWSRSHSFCSQAAVASSRASGKRGDLPVVVIAVVVVCQCKPVVMNHITRDHVVSSVDVVFGYFIFDISFCMSCHSQAWWSDGQSGWHFSCQAFSDFRKVLKVVTTCDVVSHAA